MPTPNPSVSRHTVQEATILTSRSELEIRDAIDAGSLTARFDGQQFTIRADDLALWFRERTEAVTS